MNAKNLWILTEERPKKEVLKTIFEYFAKDHQCGFFGDTLRIIPILNEKHEFAFIYEVIYNPQNEMFQRFKTKCSFLQNEAYLCKSFFLP